MLATMDLSLSLEEDPENLFFGPLTADSVPSGTKRIRGTEGEEEEAEPEAAAAASVASQAGPTPQTPPAGAAGSSPATPRSPAAQKDSRQSSLTAEQKVQKILDRHGQSYSEELGVHMQLGGPNALWQWFCASVLFSARIKSNAAVRACQALFCSGINSPEAVRHVTKEHCRQVLHASGYERYDDKAAGFIVDDAHCILREYGDDLNRLREKATCNPAQERVLLKKFKGVGDGGVDIFFREAQAVWHELFPFADKKALKAARLVGLREHPQSLADLCANDVTKYVRLISALVRIELSKTYNEF